MYELILESTVFACACQNPEVSYKGLKWLAFLLHSCVKFVSFHDHVSVKVTDFSEFPFQYGSTLTIFSCYVNSVSCIANGGRKDK